MNEELLRKVKNTLVVMLREREAAEELLLLGSVVRWGLEPVSNTDMYDDDELLEARLFLPAQAFARLDSTDRNSAAQLIMTTLNEVTSSLGQRFVSLSFYPELVEELSFTQQELLEWLKRTLDRRQEEAAFSLPDDDSPPF
jgi:hypothetical protein